jgi:hypothetical protein
VVSIFNIVTFKTLKLLGQAWVVFDDVSVTTNAIRQMQGFPFYDKCMVSNFAILMFVYSMFYSFHTIFAIE